MCIRDRPRTVRWDGDDTYLVVAADKGTASFSDIANELALEHGFWLGDAFASGGSHGYDPVSYTHLRAHETVLDLVCRLLLEKKKNTKTTKKKKKKNTYIEKDELKDTPRETTTVSYEKDTKSH